MVHIGDNWACDVRGALDAGITAIWISQGRHVPEDALVLDQGVLVAHDLGAAAAHVHHLARSNSQ
jgi:FMN phosphatase YigB (HAD superfamily)